MSFSRTQCIPSLRLELETPRPRVKFSTTEPSRCFVSVMFNFPNVIISNREGGGEGWVTLVHVYKGLFKGCLHLFVPKVEAYA